jgi:hypothetical protein
MSRIQVIAVAPEGLGQPAYQRRADCGHSNRSAAFGHQATHRCVAGGVAVDQPKKSHRRANIHVGPIIRHPVPHGHGHGRQLPGAAPDAVSAGRRLAVDAQVVEGLDDAHLESFEILADRKTVPTQRHQWVDGQLARAMQQAAAPAVHPADLDLPAPQQVAFVGQIGGRAGPADRDNLRMLAQQQRYLAVVAVGRLRQEPLLQFQTLTEIDPAQQVCLDRGRGFGL